MKKIPLWSLFPAAIVGLIALFITKLILIKINAALVTPIDREMIVFFEGVMFGTGYWVIVMAITVSGAEDVP